MGFLWLYLVYNMDVMEAWQILLIIIAIVLFVYMAGLFIVLSYAFDFNARIRRRLNAINMILFEKRRIILEIYNACIENGSTFEEKFVSSLNQFQTYEFKKPRFDDCKNAISLQKFIQSRLFYEFQLHPALKESASISSNVTMLEDLDHNIRTSCSLFNADAQGYNYWINVPGYHWFFFLIGKRNLSSII